MVVSVLFIINFLWQIRSGSVAKMSVAVSNIIESRYFDEGKAADYSAVSSVEDIELFLERVLITEIYDEK